MKAKDWLMLAGLGIGGYFLYQLLNAGKKQFDKGTNLISTGIANAILSLTQQPPMNVLGNIVLPDGSDGGPLANTPVYTDSKGGVYIKSVTGDVYSVGKSDSNGNWPVTLVQSNYQIPDNFGLTDSSGW